MRQGSHWPPSNASIVTRGAAQDVPPLDSPLLIVAIRYNASRVACSMRSSHNTSLQAVSFRIGYFLSF